MLEETVLVPLCDDCVRRPSGLEGHDRIFLTHDERSPDGRHLFRCSACRSLWLREYAGDGVFAWVMVPYEDDGRDP